MNFRIVAVLLVGALLTFGCGEEGTERTSREGTWWAEIGGAQRADLVAFVAPGANTVLQMNADGTNVQPFTGPRKASQAWPNQERILNSVCDPSFGGRLDDPIELVSPDGVSLGLLDDSWEPQWSNDGNFAAVACGRADGGQVVVVSDVEMPGTRDGWSRSGRGTLSDRIEVLIVKVDGSTVTQLTQNEAGDWLPRWDPAGAWVLIESNRDGNSEIYQLHAFSTESYRITNREADDQAPVWSEHGLLLAFASNVNGEFEVHVDDPPGVEPLSTGQAGRPVPWSN